MQNICILGASGSVGQAALSVIQQHPQHYTARILVANSNWRVMAEQCRTHRPAVAVMADDSAAKQLAAALAGENITIDGGAAAVRAAAASASCTTVIAAIAGASGVESLLAAAKSGKRILLANKEALITAGALLPSAFTAEASDTAPAGTTPAGTTPATNTPARPQILPIDSEHCALFELLQNDRNYKTLWLTASGGSVRDVPLQQLPQVTPAMALAHPNWSMGKKITVDSATMMNKVLEIMEAAVLFEAPPSAIKVVIHPQSTCHALVEYPDGALQANFSQPDMRLPIARMLAYPARLPQVVPPLSWQALSTASFFLPDEARYPCLPLAYQALALGGAAPAALSAANEVAVARFLSGDIQFTDIARINSEILNHLHAENTPATTLEDIRTTTKKAQQKATQIK